MRLDKWLWAARFYKTRSLAADAIGKGRIQVNEQRIKRSRTIGVGDTVQIQRNPFVYHIAVLGLNEQRRPASEAQALYAESEGSIEERQRVAATLRNEHIISRGLMGAGRPHKRQRRQIIRFQNRGAEPDPGDYHPIEPPEDHPADALNTEEESDDGSSGAQDKT